MHLDRKVILASKSPRRSEILNLLGLDFEIIVSDVDESKIKIKNPKKLVAELSKLKGEAVKNLENIDKEALIISADTVVAYKGQILGKPKTDVREIEMLNLLNGKKHKVYTGVTIIDVKSDTLNTFVCEAVVEFDKLSSSEIEEYTKSGEGQFLAGGYGIQGTAGSFIKGIKGDYYTIMGLPACRLRSELNKIK